ncbi:MAG: hypothetical protein KKB70_08365 [Proteobacteria bacterium]|nr:hypothetical protein [Pseudomonadota bacterium]
MTKQKGIHTRGRVSISLDKGFLSALKDRVVAPETVSERVEKDLLRYTALVRYGLGQIRQQFSVLEIKCLVDRAFGRLDELKNTELWLSSGLQMLAHNPHFDIEEVRGAGVDMAALADRIGNLHMVERIGLLETLETLCRLNDPKKIEEEIKKFFKE